MVSFNNYYKARITEITGVTETARVDEIEEIMREMHGGVLSEIDKPTFERSAKAAKEVLIEMEAEAAGQVV